MVQEKILKSSKLKPLVSDFEGVAKHITFNLSFYQRNVINVIRSIRAQEGDFLIW